MEKRTRLNRTSVMKQFLPFSLLPLLVGLVCFAAIYAGSGILTTRSDGEREHRLPQGQRFLSDRDRDPILMDIGLLRDVADMFNRTPYSRKTKPEGRKSVRPLVADYMSADPLHLFVETEAKITSKGGSVDRTLKDFYYYDKSGK